MPIVIFCAGCAAATPVSPASAQAAVARRSGVRMVMALEAIDPLLGVGRSRGGFPMTPLWGMAGQARPFTPPRVASRGPAPASSVLVFLLEAIDPLLRVDPALQ